MSFLKQLLKHFLIMSGVVFYILIIGLGYSYHPYIGLFLTILLLAIFMTLVEYNTKVLNQLIDKKLNRE